MAEIKTKVNDASVKDFLDKVEPESKREDAFKLLKIFEEVSGEKAKMWGSAIVGFGMYHYKSERSAQEGDWPRTGFSPRKQNLTLYVHAGLNESENLLAKLGKYKTSVGCLYINKLSDVDEKVLREIITKNMVEMEKHYPSK